jgi:hypothetical protein
MGHLQENPRASMLPRSQSGGVLINVCHFKKRRKPDKVDGLPETMRRLIPEVRKKPGSHVHCIERVV